jgi:peptide/nickel transport system substrate-binding protein
MRRSIFAVLSVVLLASGVAWAASPPGTVVVAQGVDPTTLDPQNHQETPAANLAVNLFDTLLERDQDLKIVPGVAESYRNVSPMVWEFKLRRGVKFHNGEPLDAEAVKFTVERMVDPKLKLRGATPWTPVSHGEVVDAQTVRIHTKAPWPILDTMVTTLPILAPKYYREKDMAHVAKNPVGSGPFKFVRWVKDDRIELEANAQYWRGAPKVKTLVFRPIPDDAVRVAALQNAEIDVAVNIPPHLANIIANHPRLFLSTAPSVRTIQLMYYTHQFDAQHKLVGPYAGPVADRRVRMAMTHAVDVDEIIKNVLDGKGIRTATMLTDKHFGFDPQLKPMKQDLGRVKQLLTEAGHPNGVEMVLNAPQGRYVRDKEVAEAVTGQLNKAGIKTTLRTFEFVSYLNNMVYVHKAGPVWLIGWGHPTMDAEAIYVPLFKSPNIFVNWHNEDFNGMVEQAQSEMDARKRLALYHRINKFWIDETPAIPLYQQIDLYGANRRVNWKARSDELIRAYDMALKEGK